MQFLLLLLYVVATVTAIPVRRTVISITPDSTIRTSTSSTSSQIAFPKPITGCGMSTFDIRVAISDPLKPMNLILDTGSSSLGVVSDLCTSCDAALQPRYVTSDAHLYDSDPVMFRYGDGSSITGPTYRDTINVANVSEVATMTFLAVASNDGFFSSQNCQFDTDPNIFQGILGMAFPALAVAPTTGSFMDALVAANNMLDQFTLQLCDEGGNIWFGGFDARFFEGPMQYVPMLESYDFYKVNVLTLTIDGNSVASAPFEVVVDSGTTDTILDPTTFNALINVIYDSTAFQTAFNNDRNFFTNGLCITSSQTRDFLNANLPKMSITLTNNVVLSLDPVTSYLMPFYYHNTGIVLYCPGVTTGASSPKILGFSAMNQYTITFDRTNKQIGFAPTKLCGTIATPFAFYVAVNWTACTPDTGVTGVQTSIYSECILPNGSVSTNATLDCADQNPQLTRKCSSADSNSDSNNLLHTLIPYIIVIVIAVFLIILTCLAWYACRNAASQRRRGGVRRTYNITSRTRSIV